MDAKMKEHVLEEFRYYQNWYVLERRGWTDFYSPSFPGWKVRKGRASSYTEVLPFPGIDLEIIRGRIIDALRKTTNETDLLDLAAFFALKIK